MPIKKILFYIIGTCSLLIPAFYNGYPLVYSDTGSYMFGGMDLVLPKDRPIMYGLFIHFFSLNFSLWMVICAQALIVFFVLWQVFKLAANSPVSKRFFILSMALLSWFTGLGWYTSQLMPDIFTIITLSTILLLLFREKHSVTQNIIFSIVLIFSMNTHFSNYLIASGTIFILLVFSRHRRFLDIRKEISFRLPIIAIIVAIAVGSTTNFVIGKTFKISQNSHVFLMGKMLDSGVLKSFLDDNCATKKYSLCDCKNVLPESSRNLLWDVDSPLQRNGDWKNSEEDYNRVLAGIATSPKHLSLFLYNDIWSFITQLFQNDLGSGLVSNWYGDPTSPPYTAISKYFPYELNQYKQSRQNTNLWEQNLDLKLINYINFFLLLTSTMIIINQLFLSSKRTQYNSKTRIVIFTLLIGIVINAIVISSLANVYDRLQARVSWALIFCAFLLFTYHKTQLTNSVSAFLKNKDSK